MYAPPLSGLPLLVLPAFGDATPQVLGGVVHVVLGGRDVGEALGRPAVQPLSPQRARHPAGNLAHHLVLVVAVLAQLTQEPAAARRKHNNVPHLFYVDSPESYVYCIIILLAKGSSHKAL